MYLERCKKYIIGIICVSMVIPNIVTSISSYADTDDKTIATENKFEITRNTAVKQKKSIFSKTVSKLAKGDVIEVESQNGNWSEFEYESNKIGYVSNVFLKKHYETKPGEVTIKYVDKNTKQEICESDIYKELDLTKHTFKAKEIEGYKYAKFISSTTVKLTDKKPTATIIFEYKKIDNNVIPPVNPDSKTGEIIINYIDNETKTTIVESDVYSDLELKAHVYEAKTIEGYQLIGEESKTIKLTSESPKQAFDFIYEKNKEDIIPTPDEEKGSVQIEYINMENKEKLSDTDIYDNLQLKEYLYQAKEIEGYVLVGESEKRVTLTKENKDELITFEYEKEEKTEETIKGEVTVKYIDKNTKLELSVDDIFKNLELGTHMITAKEIDGYDVLGERVISINITESNRTPLIIFEYEKSESDILPVTGDITIKYIEKETKKEIKSTDVYSNVELKEYTFDAKTIAGYNVFGEKSKTVLLTEQNKSELIIFEYEKITTTEKINEVPYISTYYVKPIVKIGEDVKLDFYITDYSQKEYKEGDKSELFTITVKIEGKEDIVKTFKAGDNSINIGSFDKEGEVKFSIKCTDQYGRNSHELFNYFLVRNEVNLKEYTMTNQDLEKYNIKNTDNYEEILWVNIPTNGITNQIISTAINDAYNKHQPEANKYTTVRVSLDGKEESNRYWNYNRVKYSNDYNKEVVLAESKTTREGLQQFLDDKASEGYNKVNLLSGVYRIDHEKPIYIPTKMTVDMNQATFKLNQFTGDKALMVSLNNTFDSHLINGIIQGDYYSHDYANSPNNSEWVNGIEIGGEAKYSSFEDLVVKDITGYGGGNGIANSRDGKLGYTYFYPKSIGTFSNGDVDRVTGEDVNTKERTTSGYVDVSNYPGEGPGYIQVGPYLGYQGNPCGTWNIIAHFYDSEKNYIESVDGYLYRRIEVPENASYMRVTILNESFPTNLSSYYFRVPTHCSFKNVKFENCRCVGLAQSAMKDMLVENCEFINSGQSSAKCAYDAEDGWDMMQDVTFRKLNFHDNPNNEFLTCAGHNFVVEDMIQGNVYIWDRTNSFVYRGNSSSRGSINLKMAGRTRGGYYRVYDNEINGNISVVNAGGIADNWKMVIRDNKINGRASNELGAGKYLNCEIGTAKNPATGSTWDTALGEGEFENCYVHDKNGENQGGIYRNCKIENIKGNMHRVFDVKDSEITNWTCNGGSYDPTYNFKNNKMTNFSIQLIYWSQGAKFNISDNTINNSDYLIRLPHYAMKESVNISNNVIKGEGANGLIWYYDDRTGGSAGEAVPQDKLTLEGNSIEMKNSKYIVNGLSKTGKNNINIISRKNVYNKDILELCNPEARECSEINIVED